MRRFKRVNLALRAGGQLAGVDRAGGNRVADRSIVGFQAFAGSIGLGDSPSSIGMLPRAGKEAHHLLDYLSLCG